MVSILLTIMEKVPNTDGRLLEWEIYPQKDMWNLRSDGSEASNKEGLGFSLVLSVLGACERKYGRHGRSC